MLNPHFDQSPLVVSQSRFYAQGLRVLAQVVLAYLVVSPLVLSLLLLYPKMPDEPPKARFPVVSLSGVVGGGRASGLV